MSKALSHTVLLVSTAVCGTTILVLFPTAIGQQQQPLNQTIPQTNINFTQLFSEQLTGPTCVYKLCHQHLVVVHQSPTTVVLEGKQIAFTMENKFVNNDVIWKGVDMVKRQGYTIDSVIMSGIASIENPNKYHIIMSRN